MTRKSRMMASPGEAVSAMLGMRCAYSAFSTRCERGQNSVGPRRTGISHMGSMS